MVDEAGDDQVPANSCRPALFTRADRLVIKHRCPVSLKVLIAAVFDVTE